MIRLYLFLSLSVSLCVAMSSCSDTKPSLQESSEPIETATLGYDSLLAQSLGADDYGMRTYVMALLSKGPNRDLSDEEAEKLQRAHLDNISRLADEGLLQLAGPFYGDGDLRGIYIFSVESIKEAQKLVETDPAIQSGSLKMELHKWYGSAAVMDIPRLHKLISKEGV